MWKVKIKLTDFTKILDKAKELINGHRAKSYGDAYINHKRIAELWSVILEKEISVPTTRCRFCSTLFKSRT